VPKLAGDSVQGSTTQRSVARRTSAMNGSSCAARADKIRSPVAQAAKL
jgi:hypothetical protein